MFIWTFYCHSCLNLNHHTATPTHIRSLTCGHIQQGFSKPTPAPLASGTYVVLYNRHYPIWILSSEREFRITLSGIFLESATWWDSVLFTEQRSPQTKGCYGGRLWLSIARITVQLPTEGWMGFSAPCNVYSGSPLVTAHWVWQSSQEYFIVRFWGLWSHHQGLWWEGTAPRSSSLLLRRATEATQQAFRPGHCHYVANISFWQLRRG